MEEMDYNTELKDIIELGINFPLKADEKLSILAVKLEEYLKCHEDNGVSLLLNLIDEFRKGTRGSSTVSERYKLLYQSLYDKPDQNLIDDISVKDYLHSIFKNPG